MDLGSFWGELKSGHFLKNHYGTHEASLVDLIAPRQHFVLCQPLYQVVLLNYVFSWRSSFTKYGNSKKVTPVVQHHDSTLSAVHLN